jgi:hypothetical protein
MVEGHSHHDADGNEREHGNSGRDDQQDAPEPQ